MPGYAIAGATPPILFLGLMAAGFLIGFSVFA